MGRFASIQDIEGKLDDFEIQCITDWWGDPVRNILDQSIEKDIFEKYQNGEYCHSLVRLETYITIIILKMLFMKCPPKTTRRLLAERWLWDHLWT